MTNLEQNPYIQRPKLSLNRFIGILADKIDLVLEIFHLYHYPLQSTDSGVSKGTFWNSIERFSNPKLAARYRLFEILPS